MIRILHVSASTREASSRSRMAAGMVLARLRESHPSLDIVERDLATRPPPTWTPASWKPPYCPP